MQGTFLRANYSAILFSNGYRTNFRWLTLKLQINHEHINFQPKLFSTASISYNSKSIITDEQITSDIEKDSQQEWIRIYTGSLSDRIKLVKMFSLSTSGMGLVVQPMLLEKGTELGGSGVAILLCGVAGIFTFVTPFLLHLITKKYVAELDFKPNTDEYKATIISIVLRRIEVNIIYFNHYL